MPRAGVVTRSLTAVGCPAARETELARTAGAAGAAASAGARAVEAEAAESRLRNLPQVAWEMPPRHLSPLARAMPSRRLSQMPVVLPLPSPASVGGGYGPPQSNIPLVPIAVAACLFITISCLLLARFCRHRRAAAAHRRAAERGLSAEDGAGGGLAMSLADADGRSMGGPAKGLDPALVAALPRRTFEELLGSTAAESTDALFQLSRQHWNHSTAASSLALEDLGSCASTKETLEDLGSCASTKETEGEEEGTVSEGAFKGGSQGTRLGPSLGLASEHNSGVEKQQSTEECSQEQDCSKKQDFKKDQDCGKDAADLEALSRECPLPGGAKERDLEGLCRECPVCLVEYERADVLRTIPHCGHSFHERCLVSWLSGRTTCPLCRTDLQPGSM